MIGRVLLGAILTVLLSGMTFEAQAAWSIDPKNRAVVNGSPVFLRIAYDQWFDTNDVPAGHIATRNFDQYGFNVYLHFMMGSFENALKQLPALPPSMFGMATGNAHGSATVEQMGMNGGVQTFDLVNNPNNFRGRFNGEPKAGGVYLADEPDIRVLNNIKQWATTYKTDLPGMPRFAVLLPEGPLIPQDGQYGSTGFQESIVSDPATGAGVANPYWWARNGGGGDWLAEDPYPLLFTETTTLAPWGFPHFWVADRAAHVVAAAKQNGQVPVIVLQLFEGIGNARFINVDELWSHVVMAVAEGVHGIAWWNVGRAGFRPTYIGTPLDDALKSITLLLRDLEPVILSDPNPALLVGNSTSTGNAVVWREGVLDAVAGAIANYNYGAGGRGSYVAEKNALLAGVTQWSPMLDQSGDVRTRSWETADGTGYVFAYNYHPQQRNAVTLTWHTNLQRVEVVGEGRTITPNGASWTDDFGGSSSLNMGGKRIGHIYKLIPTGVPPGTPTVTFTNPVNNATVSGTITVSLSASGGSGTYTNYTVKVDGTTIFSGQNSSFSWNTTTVPNGSHTLTATVTDSANMTSPEVRITVNVSQPPPPGNLAVFITSPTAGQTISGTNWVVIWSENAQGAVQYTVSVAGQQRAAGPQSSPQPTSIPWNTTAVANGPQTITVTGTDAAGHTATTSVNVTVSNGPPLAVFITSPTAGQTISGTNWVVIWSENAQGAVQYTVSVAGQQRASGPQSSPQPTSIPWNTTAVANGAQTITVTGTDAAGRTATTSVNVNVAN